MRKPSLLWLIPLFVIAGCQSVGQDFSDLARSVTPKTPREAALMMLDQYDPDNRREGTVLIANSDFGGAEVYVRAYRDMVENERNPLVLAAAIRALARFGDPVDAELIATHFEDESEQVRWEAAKGLQRLHHPPVLPEILRTLADPEESTDVRVAAARALGQYPEDRAFQGLVAALDAPALAINLAAEESLQTLTGQSYEMRPKRWLVWYNDEAGSQPFAKQQEFVYPAYQRDETWWEKAAFWTGPIEEQPGVPTGLRPEDERSTYQDSPVAASAADEAGPVDSR